MPLRRREILYSRWCGMKQRCDYAHHVSSLNYSQKGIKYSDDWKDFKSFQRDMLPTYKQGLWLDRIDGSKGYSKENCRWVNALESNQNRANTLTARSVSLIKALIKSIKPGIQWKDAYKIIGDLFHVRPRRIKDVRLGFTWQNVT